MAQPDYVPLVSSDRVRPSSRLSTPRQWRQDRPAELLSLRPPQGGLFGSTGPDLGYGLMLAKRVAERAVLAEGEHLDDAVAGCFACGCRRASVFHRAPVIYDMEWAFAVWGYLPGAPEEVAVYRRVPFAGAAHDYFSQRAIADVVSEEAIRLPAGNVHAGLAANWRKWLGALAPASGTAASGAPAPAK